MLKTTKLKSEKPVRLTAFQKLQSVQSIGIFFKFVGPSLPFFVFAALPPSLSHHATQTETTAREAKLQYAFENILARLI